MATRPATHKAGRAPTRVHSTNPSPKYGQGRGGRPWRRLRKQILDRDMWLCQCDDCKLRFVPLPADEVDHIDNRRDAQGNLNDSPDNLRAINHDCHALKTAQESSVGAQASMLPGWMPTPTKPLIVVCGPPGAGKTTYVTEHAGKRDLVLDLDVMAVRAMGKNLSAMTKEERSNMVRLRNDSLGRFARGQTTHPKCYLIATAGSFKQRKFWRDKGAEVIVIDTSKDECKMRVMDGASRDEAGRARALAAIEMWA